MAFKGICKKSNGSIDPSWLDIGKMIISAVAFVTNLQTHISSVPLSIFMLTYRIIMCTIFKKFLCQLLGKRRTTQKAGPETRITKHHQSFDLGEQVSWDTLSGSVHHAGALRVPYKSKSLFGTFDALIDQSLQNVEFSFEYT